jgi:hypothetical protein
MHKKTGVGRTAKTQGVSLTPEQKKYAQRRASSASLGFSAYVQRLIEYDRAKNILPEALTLTLQEQIPA